MLKPLIFVIGFFIAALAGNVPAGAQTAKPLLDTKIVFSKDGSAQVTYQTFGTSAQDTVGNKIESALVFYAYVMNKLDDATRKALMGEVQASVTKIATEQGMVRADLIRGVPFIKPLSQDPPADGLKISFADLAGKGHSLEVTPVDGGGLPMASAVLYYFQDLVKNLPENGVRLLVLSMGGMNKWYRELGQATDPASVTKAPSYGLNVAVEILQKLSKKSS